MYKKEILGYSPLLSFCKCGSFYEVFPVKATSKNLVYSEYCADCLKTDSFLQLFCRQIKIYSWDESRMKAKGAKQEGMK